jgi:predicted DNA-binding transcriptional regulator AlpA
MASMTKLWLVPSGMVSVKALAAQYGISKSTLYELIRADPTFPYKNIGAKKKFMVDAAMFEKWIEARTERERDNHFGLSTANEVLGKHKR